MNTPGTPSSSNTILRIAARSADVGGGIPVHRLMPSAQRRMIGAWCFLDHAGPAEFSPGAGLRVGPHPHIGLQTFTWMIAGEVLHRDSLGNVQVVRPGQVNLMTAGHGIAHSEESLTGEDTLHAVQLWIALPSGASACAPAFDHHPVLPAWSEGGCDFTLLAGKHGDHVAPARLYSSLVGIDLFSREGGAIELALDPTFEYGILVLAGEALIDAERFSVDELAYLGRGVDSIGLRLVPGSRAIVLGGLPFSEEILLWWNFVAHSKDEIAQARHDWESGQTRGQTREQAGGSARFGRVDGYDGAPLSAPALPWPAS